MDTEKQNQACKDEKGGRILLKRNDMGLFKELAEGVITGRLPPLENCTVDDIKNAKNTLPLPAKPAGKSPAQ